MSRYVSKIMYLDLSNEQHQFETEEVVGNFFYIVFYYIVICYISVLLFWIVNGNVLCGETYLLGGTHVLVYLF